jgi:glycosyltransferase involved in cell wall biosynthesis
LEHLKGRIDELKMEGAVRFLPFTTEVPALMNAFDLSLLPSRGETFGLVVIEAMAAGVPVIATDAGGVPEIIEHKQNGILIPPGDSDALAKAMRLMAENEPLRKEIVGQARQDTIERFHHRTQAAKFFDFCNAVYMERQRRLRRS